MAEFFLEALGHVSSPAVLLLILLGVLIGIIGGSIPGFTVTMAQNGEPGRALGIGVAASFIGTVIWCFSAR